MTEADKELLLHLVTRISMYVFPVEASSVTNFIHGYEAGIGNKHDFTEQLSQLISEKYKVNRRAMGWPNQIERLAKRRHSTWLIIFRRITLEIIVSSEGGSLSETQQAFLKKAVVSCIERVEPTPPPWLGDDWVDDWRALSDVKSDWFKQLWSRKEWTVIRAIDKLVQTNGIFRDEKRRLPSPALLALKSAYGKATSDKQKQGTGKSQLAVKCNRPPTPPSIVLA